MVEWNGLRGTGGADRFRGTAAAETFWGLGGNDVITGAGGFDRIEGGAGADTLTGGSGADTLTGGTGADRLIGDIGRDVFVFGQLDSGRGAKRRDVIVDFVAGQDRIDLSSIDADVGTGSVDALIWADDRATAHGVWAVAATGGLSLRGDTTGDGLADFEIWLTGATSLQEFALIL